MSTEPPAPPHVSPDGKFYWDGQRWVPTTRGSREPTPWTRPMQLAAAALFAALGVVRVASTLLFVNHDSVLRAIQAQGMNIRQGTSVDTVVNIAIAGSIGIALVDFVAALGSYRGWRWMFWAALIGFVLGGIGALTNFRYIVPPGTLTLRTGSIAVSEVFSLAELAMFVWLLVGLVKFGPWAMKKPGHALGVT